MNALPFHPSCEIFILAGGLSERMGHDKSSLQFHGQTLLQMIRATAKITGWPVRVVRNDTVKRCGPLGGIYTALKRSRKDFVILMACDMPFIQPDYLMALASAPCPRAIFTGHRGNVGFPFVLPRKSSLPLVRQQIRETQFSIQKLATKLKAKTMLPRKQREQQLTNLNTPAEFRAAQRKFAASASQCPL